MHDDEQPSDIATVRRLIATQFPEWSELKIVPVTPAGTDNAMFQLGDDLVVRLPRIAAADGRD